MLKHVSPALLAACWLAACAPTTPGTSITILDASIAMVDVDGGGITGDGGMLSSSSSGGSLGSSTSGATSGDTSSAGFSGRPSSAPPSSGLPPRSSSLVAASSSTMPRPCMSDLECDVGSMCTANGTCQAGCVDNSRCPAWLPACEPMLHQCVACVSSMDCSSSVEACVNNQCVTSCQDGSPCPAGLTCLLPQNVCVQCLDDSGCGNGTICQANACVPGCRAMPNTCPLGTICNTNAAPNGVCRVAGCQVDGDCGDPNVVTCVAGTCERRCQSNAECPSGTLCTMGACVQGCQLPDRACPRGEYCSATNGAVGQCAVGCAAQADCTSQTNNVCDVQSHTCVECASDMDCPGGRGLPNGTCTNLQCVWPCTGGMFDACRLMGMQCDQATGVCVGCTSQADCADTETCTANRCVSNGNLPLCATCETDAECGGPLDLCVIRNQNNQRERVCGVDCSAGQACPPATQCLQVGGSNGNPLRGYQCLPANSAQPFATCGARNDLLAQTTCNSGVECGIMRVANTQGNGDAICSGAGGSQGMCSMFCTLGGNDCPEGFFCEDPPDTPMQPFAPRCSPNP